MRTKENKITNIAERPLLQKRAPTIGAIPRIGIGGQRLYYLRNAEE